MRGSSKRLWAFVCSFCLSLSGVHSLFKFSCFNLFSLTSDRNTANLFEYRGSYWSIIWSIKAKSFFTPEYHQFQFLPDILKGVLLQRAVEQPVQRIKARQSVGYLQSTGSKRRAWKQVRHGVIARKVLISSHVLNVNITVHCELDFGNQGNYMQWWWGIL